MPVTSWLTWLCDPGSDSKWGSTHATQAAKNLPQGEKWAPISLQKYSSSKDSEKFCSSIGINGHTTNVI